MRAPYVNKDGFRFTIYRKGFFSDLGKMLGMQDMEIGEPEFDDAFIIKGNDEFKLRKMLGDRKIRQLIEQRPKVYLTVRDQVNRLAFGQEDEPGLSMRFVTAGSCKPRWWPRSRVSGSTLAGSCWPRLEADQYRRFQLGRIVAMMAVNLQ
jgi:hypothetical protein